MTRQSVDSVQAQALINAERERLAAAVRGARSALREDSGGLFGNAWTVPLIAAGLGLVAALGLRRLALNKHPASE